MLGWIGGCKHICSRKKMLVKNQNLQTLVHARHLRLLHRVVQFLVTTKTMKTIEEDLKGDLYII